jgi:hypothetical protein
MMSNLLEELKKEVCSTCKFIDNCPDDCPAPINKFQKEIKKQSLSKQDIQQLELILSWIESYSSDSFPDNLLTKFKEIIKKCDAICQISI